MKNKFILVFIVFFISNNLLWAQAPKKINYQETIRDKNNVLITNHTVGIQISILKDSEIGTPVYIETHTSTTNVNGLVTLVIGTGKVISGSFDNINWRSGLYFIKTETDINGGVNYTLTNRCKILSVPYAFYATTAEFSNETDSVFLNSDAANINDSDVIYWNNKLDKEIDSSITNELQFISISNDTINLTDGGFAVLPAGFDGNYNSLINKPINLSAFNNDVKYLIYEKDSSVTNELQIINIYNNYIYLSNGGYVTLPSGFNVSWSTLSGKPNFATVATSGSYVDLSNKPSIPTMTNQLTNNSGFLTYEKDSSITNELQTISIILDTIFISNGGFIFYPKEKDSVYNKSVSATINSIDTINWNNKQNKLIQGVGINIRGDTISATGLGTGGSSNNFLYLGKDTLGGIIFYLFSDSLGNQHGLVVSKTETTAKYQFSNALINANCSWDGLYNMNQMSNSPAKDSIIANLGTDWYLPSIDELSLLWQNLFHVNKGLFLANAVLFSYSHYWSSTEYSWNTACYIEFSYGAIGAENKTTVSKIRAIKAF